MDSVIKPLQTLNNDGVAVRAFGQQDPTMYQLWRFIDTFTAYDARTVYLEKWLNIYWDPVKERIKINNNNTLPVFYMFNTVEEADPTYFFNEWDETVAYVDSPEDYVSHRGFIYVAHTNNTNKEPPDIGFWFEYDEIEYFFNAADTLPPDFTVEVPIAVELNSGYSTERITNQVQLFNAAGTTFNIQIV